MPGKCVFHDSWLSDPDFKEWIRASTVKTEAYCLVCRKTVNISHGGVSDLRAHRKGKKHSDLEKPLQKNSTQKNLDSFTMEKKNDVPQEKSCMIDVPGEKNTTVSNTGTSSTSSSMNKWLCSQDVRRAEIIWAVKRIISHESSRGTQLSAICFRAMFHDSEIAKNFTMGKDKAAYIVTYGLGPFFQDQLLRSFRSKDYFAISVDEALNKVCVKNQMDVIVRYYNNVDMRVETRYISSLFLKNGQADTVRKAIIDDLGDRLQINLHNMIQFATDGPNINLKLFRDLYDELSSTAKCKLLDTGTCALHIVNNAYKEGHKHMKWNVIQFLRKLYYLFHMFPRRRADFIHFSGTSLFPHKFCGTRWLENGSALQRACDILDSLKLYFEGTKKNPPKSNCYRFVAKTLEEDRFLKAKMQFMITLADQFEPFLTIFQSDASLFPFLYEKIESLIKNIGSRFLKKIVYQTKLKDQLLKDVNDTDIGFGASDAIKKMKVVDILEFKQECRSYLRAVYCKLVQKLPIDNITVKGASCLAPQIMLNQKLREDRIQYILQSFIDANILKPQIADRIKNDYLGICADRNVADYLKTFKDIFKLHDFLLKIEEIYPCSNDFTEFMKIVFILFHGNSAVERSFSVNKECLLTNLEEDSLVAQRLVYDHAKTLEFDPTKLDITSSMIEYVKSSSAKRKDNLKLKQDEKKGETDLKRKAMNDLKILEIKKSKIMESRDSEIKMLNENIEHLKKKLL